jgi:hypothetical protein
MGGTRPAAPALCSRRVLLPLLTAALITVPRPVNGGVPGGRNLEEESTNNIASRHPRGAAAHQMGDTASDTASDTAGNTAGGGAGNGGLWQSQLRRSMMEAPWPPYPAYPAYPPIAPPPPPPQPRYPRAPLFPLPPPPPRPPPPPWPPWPLVPPWVGTDG